MAIQRVDSSFIIGFQQIRQSIELAVSQENSEVNSQCFPIKSSKKEKSLALSITEAFGKMTEHKILLEDLSERLECDFTQGLTEDQARNKQKTYGLNRISDNKETPIYCMFLRSMLGWHSLLLWLASFVCFVSYGLAHKDTAYLFIGIVLDCLIVLAYCVNYFHKVRIDVMIGRLNKHMEVHRKKNLL